MRQQETSVPPYEQELCDFLSARGSDPEAVSAVFGLYRTATDVIAAMEVAALRPLGLTHAGFVLLMTLWVTGPREPRELALVQRVSRPTVVGTVDTLEARGLVRRTRSQADRRLVSVELTPRGRRLIAKAQRAWHRREAEVAGRLTAAERRTFIRLTRKLRAAIEDVQVARAS